MKSQWKHFSAEQISFPSIAAVVEETLRACTDAEARVRRRRYWK